MVEITDVTIISIDKNDEPWSVEGEILFESDLPSPFSALYYDDDDEFENLEIEINPGSYDNRVLKEMIVSAIYNYED